MIKRKKIGSTVGKNLVEIKFVYDSYDSDGISTDVQLGQILVIQDKITNDRFFIRVIDIHYGQSDLWSMEVARDINAIDDVDLSDEHSTPNDIYQANMRQQMFLVAIAEPIGMVGENGKFVSVKKMPSYFSPVFKIQEGDFGADVRNQLGDLTIGKLRSGSDVLNIDVGLFSNLLPYHIGIFAKTGSGKSVTMKTILASIMETMGKAGCLIFEPHGEYIQDLKKHPLAEKQLVCFTQHVKKGENARKIRISYEDITVGSLMNVKDNLMWTDAQERFLREASFSHPNWLHQILNLPLNEREINPEEPAYTLLDMFPDYKEDTLRAIRSKLRQVVEAPYVSQDSSVSNVNEILSLLEQGKTVLIDMASLSGLQELLLSTILANKVLDKRRKMYADDRDTLVKFSPSISIVMEEAQRVLGKNASPSSIFAQIVNEGRKFKVGLVAITQQPKLMNEILISQFTTLIILAISDMKDFDVLKGTAQKPLDRLREEIKALMPGQAIITSPSAPFAVPVQINFYDDYIKEVRKRLNKIVSNPTIDSFKGFV